MSARADTNCHDIFNFVSATRTHLAKIGATRCVVADMSATFPAKIKAMHVPRAFHHSGWEILTEENKMKSGDYQILWKRKVGSNGSFVIGTPWQHCSRIPRTQVFEPKDSFLAGFRRMQQRYDEKMKKQEYNPNLSQLSSNGDDLMYFIPETYRLVEESD